MTWPAAPTPGWILPSTQTLIQARPPLAVTTTFTPWNATVTLRVRAVVLPSALLASTASVLRPLVSSYGVLNVPSCATGTVTSAGFAGGAGVGCPAGVAGPDEPTHVAPTTTFVALVALPDTG